MTGMQLARSVYSALRDPNNAIRKQPLQTRKMWWRGMNIMYRKEIALRRRLLEELELDHVLTPMTAENGGAFSTSKETRALTKDAVDAAWEYIDDIDLDEVVAKAKTHKTYLFPLHRHKPLPVDSPIHKLAMHPEMVGAAGEYLGHLPRLMYASVWYSPNWDGEEKGLSGSQLYHLDHEDFQQVKAFVYLHDMDERHNPTMYVPPAESRSIYTKSFGSLTESTKRVPEEAMNGAGIRQNLGLKGSVSMLDTSSCLHAGGRCKAPRFMIAYQYLSAASFVRKLHRDRTMTFLDRPDLEEWERYLLDLANAPK